MPQIDLVDTLVRCSSGGDSKVSCESLVPLSNPDSDPNLPPDSIRIPILDSDIHYNNLNLERDDSAKESTNPKSQSHTNPNNTNAIHFRSNSQRTNLKANGPIIGLPNKIKHVTCTSSRHHHRQPVTNSRIFPKRKSVAASGLEPSSPKVSCFGKVLSDRERVTCRRLHSRDSGCWNGFLTIFSCAGTEKAVVEDSKGRDVDVATRMNTPLKKINIPPEETVAVGLGGMMRFASGRRAASWGGDLEADVEGHLAVDLGRRSLDGNGMGPVAV